MDLGLSNKVILISGGTQGIGEAITKLIAEEGGIPVFIGKPDPYGPQLLGYLKKRGQQGHFIGMDLSDIAQCEAAVEETLNKYGRIDGLVNNAGINDKVGLQSATPTAFREGLNYNLVHYFSMAHFCLPALKASKGAIVNISSKTAVTGQGGTSAYTAAKGSQLALTREWAVELLPYGIRVNAVIPAEVWTPLYEKWINTFDDPKQALQQITAKIPLEQRMTRPEEIANTVVFLLSERSSHTTGQWIFVDGGYTHLDRAL